MPTSPKPRLLVTLAALTAVFAAQTAAAQSERSDVSCLKISPAALDSYANKIGGALQWATADARSNGATGQYAVAATNSRDLLQRAHQSAIAGASALRQADPSVTTYAEAGTIKEHVRAILEVVPQAAHWSIISAIYHNSSDASNAFDGTVDVLQRGNALFDDAGRCYMGLSSQQTGSASSQSVVPAPLFHFSLDTPDIDGDAKLYVKKGNAAPTAVSGPTGKALHFTGAAAVATPFNLDVAQYPQTTVTAWVKRDGQSRGSRSILSGGDGAGILLGVNANSLTVKAGPTGVSFNEKMPTDEWVFVAAVVDTANGWARLHQNDGVYRKDNIKRTGKSKSPRLYANPDNPEADKEAYLFVGASQFRNWQRSKASLAIDDVRVYAGALTVEQINAIRAETATTAIGETEKNYPTRLPGDITNPRLPLENLPGIDTGRTQIDSAGTSSCVDASTATGLAEQSADETFPGVCQTPSAAGGQFGEGSTSTDTLIDQVGESAVLDLTYGSEEEAQAAADRRARERGQAELDRQQNELEAKRRAEAAAESSQTNNETTSAAQASDSTRPRPVGERKFSALTGYPGDDQEIIDMKGEFLYSIMWAEKKDRPCHVSLNYFSHEYRERQTEPYGSYEDTDILWGTCTRASTVTKKRVSLHGTIIRNRAGVGRLEVCSTFNNNKRLKGIRIFGDVINADGTTTYEPNAETAKHKNCREWHSAVLCPAGSLATGLVIHSNDTGRGREMVGLQLVCRAIGVG